MHSEIIQWKAYGTSHGRVEGRRNHHHVQGFQIPVVVSNQAVQHKTIPLFIVVVESFFIKRTIE